MKILFVGDRDALTAGILERLTKEENDVFLLTSQQNTVNPNRWGKYKTYQYDYQSDIHDIFLSVNPATVIFAGAGYMDETWKKNQRDNLTLLAELLEESRKADISSFVLLSSTEVYGSVSGQVDENTEPMPDTLKGTWLLQCENMVDDYRRCYSLPASVLRLGPVYCKTVDPNGREWLAELRRAAVGSDPVQEAYVQPIHGMDAADALVRVLSSGKAETYNVCAASRSRVSDLVKLLASGAAPEVAGEPADRQIRSDKIKRDLEWVDFWQIEDLLREDKIAFRESPRDKKKKKQEKKSNFTLRKILENIIIFAVFATLYILSSHHQLFSQIHWMLIYVMIVSLCYGVRQGTLSVVFASAAYLFVERGDIFEMTNFYSYVANVLTIVEFIFFGIVIGYVVESLREENRLAHQQTNELQVSFNKLRGINEKNMIVKNEYEKRLLQTKNTIPNLYSIISRINVLDADRIFVELLQVVRELVNTETVALYRATPDSSYLRLITSLNPQSVMENRSWNVSKYPEIQKAIRENTVYEGDVFKKEPAVVMSIPYTEGGSVVLVIKSVPMEQMSLYYINVLRTLFLLVSDALARAAEYDSVARSSMYVENTDILFPAEFQKDLNLAIEKQRREVADFVMIRICGSDDAVAKYHRVENFFREMDVFGMDAQGELYVLLSNASRSDEEAVISRLAQRGVVAEPAQDFQAGENR